MLLAVLHQTTPETREVPYAAVYLVDEGRSSAVLIGRSEPLAKDSGCDVLLLPGSTPATQTVELWVTEAGVPAGAGSSNVVHIYRFADAAPGRASAESSTCIDQRARDQAIAATNMAHAAQNSVRGLAAAIGTATGQYD